MSDLGPLEDPIRESATGIADIISSILPKGYGFALLIFGMDETKGRMNYISNAKRADMLAALKELIARFEGNYPDEPGHA